MSITNEIKNIDSNSAAGVATFFISILGPGFLTIFLFKRDIFVSLETVKLIILSLSISAPGVIIPIWFSVMSTIVYAKQINAKKEVYGTIMEWFHKHGFGNAINMYTLLFLSYVFSWKLVSFSWCYAISILAMCIFESIYLFKRANNPEKYSPIELP